MPKNKQGGMKRKKRVHIVKESPFPIPMSASNGEMAGQWFYYTGYIEGSAVVVKHSGDMDFLFKMGFFGKGILSRSQPNFNERSHRVHVGLPQKEGQHKSIQAAVVNKRSYLVHRRYKALADGRMKEYNDVVHHEEQQQGFVDSTDEDADDDSSSSSDFDTGKMVAFKLLNSSDSASAVQVLSDSAASAAAHISGKIRSDLVSILAEVSVLSDEQITTFLRVPQDMKQLTEKFTRLRTAEVKSLQQIFSAQFPGRHFKKGEVITLDEDDSTKSENENDNAVVISDSDEADGGISEKMKCDSNDTKLLSVAKCGDKKQVNASKKDLTDWASDDSNFWADDGGEKNIEESENTKLQDITFESVDDGKKENEASSEQNQETCVHEGVIGVVSTSNGKIDEKGETNEPVSIPVQAAENEGSLKASPGENGEKGETVHTEEVKYSLLPFTENNDIDVSVLKPVVANDVEDKVSVAKDVEDKVSVANDVEDKVSVANDVEDKVSVANDVEDKVSVANDEEDKVSVAKDVEDKVSVAKDVEDKVRVANDVEDKVRVANDVEDKVRVANDVEDKVSVANDVEDKVRAANDVEDKVGVANDNSNDVDDVTDKKDKSNLQSKSDDIRGNPDDVCSIDTSQEVKLDGQALMATSISSPESSEKSIKNPLINSSEIVELPKEHPDTSLGSSLDKTPTIDLKASEVSVSMSSSEVVSKDEDDKQLLVENDNMKTVVKDKDFQKDKVSNLDCHKLDDQKLNLFSLIVEEQTENVASVSVTVAENNETNLQNPDDSVTNIDSDNSNDSDDVICIESKSAEPKKLHNFLSQTAKKAADPIVTKSVTFMSSITDKPTFVCASVGFQSWGPLLHFNFTGDASHLPTVMSVSSTSSTVESMSCNGQSQNSNAVYERIYPPIKSLVPHANSTGAVIKQRGRGLPCLNSAYVKVSQLPQLSLTSSRNGTTNMKNHPAPILRYSQSRFKPHPSVSKHTQQTTPSSEQRRILPSLAGNSSSSRLSNKISLNSSILTLSQIASYMEAFQATDIYTSSDYGNSINKVLGKNTGIEKPMEVTSLLPAVVSKLEHMFNSASPKEKRAADVDPEKPHVEIDNLLSEFHKALSCHFQSLEMPEVGESHVLKLLLSKAKPNSDILGESSNETKSNLPEFQIWLLEKRLEYLKKISSSQNVNIIGDLATNSVNKVDAPSHSRADVECEMIIDADLTDNSAGKVNASVVHMGNDGNKLSNSNTHSANSETNEDQAKNEHARINDNLKHSQKALETENRKRKFDRSDETSEESGKVKKLNDDELLSLDNEEDNKVGACELKFETQPNEEDMLADGDFLSEQLEGGPKNKTGVEESATIAVVASDISRDGDFVMEKLSDKTSGICELNSGHESASVKRELKSNILDDASLLMTETAGHSEDSKLNLIGPLKEIAAMEVTFSKEVEFTSNTSFLTLQQSAEDDLMLEDNVSSQTLSKPMSTTEPDSEKIIPENENIDKTITSHCKQEQYSSFEATKLPSSESIPCSEAVSKENQTGERLQKTEDSASNLLAKEELIISNCVDASEGVVSPQSAQLRLNKDLDSEKDVTSVQSKLSLSDEAAAKGSSRNAGTSADFQICIGSSSDEDSEPHEKIQKLHQPALEGVHPYSARDDSEGELFVVPNTSDEDYFDGDGKSESGKKGSKKQRQMWRSCTKRDPYPTEERLHLMLEEAFFLSFGLGCLKVLDPEMKKLNLTQMWQQFNVLKEQFIPHYVAYHYFRSKGWVPKSGLKFGCDLILYRDGPPFYHGSYSVVVTVVKDTTLLPVNRNGGISFDQRKLNWISMAGLNRITEHVAKELMLCFVIWPGDLTHEESLSPDCLPRFKVKEVLVSRWVSSQERENKIGEEEEIP